MLCLTFIELKSCKLFGEFALLFIEKVKIMPLRKNDSQNHITMTMLSMPQPLETDIIVTEL